MSARRELNPRQWRVIRRLLVSVLTLTLAGLLWLVLSTEGTDPTEDPLAWLRAVRNHPVALILVTALFVAGSLLMVSLYLLIIATALAFGPLTGFLYALTGSLVAAAVTYAVGYLLGRDALEQLGGERLQKASRHLGDWSLAAVLLLRILPLVPFTVVNLIGGASQIRWRDFMAGTVLGVTPAMLILSLFAGELRAWLRNPGTSDWGWLAALALLVAALLLAAAWLSRRQPSAVSKIED